MTRDSVVAQESGHRPVLSRALTSSAMLVLIRRAKPCFETYMQKQCDTFGVRDIHAIARVDELSCRSTSERLGLILPDIDRYSLIHLRLRLDAQRPAVDLGVSGRQRSPAKPGSAAEVAAALPVSLQFSEGLVPLWIFIRLISSRLPIRWRTKPCRLTGYRREEISL